MHQNSPIAIEDFNNFPGEETPALWEGVEEREGREKGGGGGGPPNANSWIRPELTESVTDTHTCTQVNLYCPGRGSFSPGNVKINDVLCRSPE